MSCLKRSGVGRAAERRTELSDPLVLRQQALIELMCGAAYRDSEMERLIGVGRQKPTRHGDETTGERILLYRKGKYQMAPALQASLCAGGFADGKLPAVLDNFEHWQLPTAVRQAKLPLLVLSQAFGDKYVSRLEARHLALRLQQQLNDRRRSEKDQLVACIRSLAKRLSELIGLLVVENMWSNAHALFEVRPWGDIAQLDVSGTGTTFFTYRWDQPCSNPFEHPIENPQPVVYTEGEDAPKGRFQSLLRHLDESLSCIAINKNGQEGAPAQEIHKLANSTRRAIASLLRRMNAPRLVSWDVTHAVCVLDDHWWEAHPDFSPVLIRQRLPNGQDWCPLPEDLPAQPILFAAEHNTPEKRCLRFLELMRDATLTLRPDMMVDIGADLIGMDACKSLNLIARHGWI
jgi:hypothetical protein